MASAKEGSCKIFGGKRMNKVLKLLRYNTGNDKKAFVEFKNDFDAVIFNASIVAYSGASISDIISIHMNKYIIDPQTYILQHDTSAFLSNKGDIKASILKYLAELPAQIKHVIAEEQRALTLFDINNVLDALVEAVYEFQVNFITKFLDKKDYSKYLNFALEEEQSRDKYAPRVIIPPYFRLKKEYGSAEVSQWLNLNKLALSKFVDKYASCGFPIAAELLLDKQILCTLDMATMEENYNIPGYEYIFIWIDDFSPMNAKQEEQIRFKNLLDTLNKIGKRPVMAYGGYDSILLCHGELHSRLYGVAQSVGYGEARNITPVGGGLPVNKYYFYPMHRRMTVGDSSSILSREGYFTGDKSEAAERFYGEICDCQQCREIIGKDINKFHLYNDSVPYSWKGNIKRNRPTAEASFFATRHFMCCKQKEWGNVTNKSLSECIQELLVSVKKYGSPQDYVKVERFVKIYVQ